MINLLDWAQQVLEVKKITLQKVTVFRKVPWSIVYLLATSNGVYYLKVSHPIYSAEAEILNYFKKYHFYHIPQIIGHNIQMNAVLLKDAGKNYHEYSNRKYHHLLMTKIINFYAKIQIKSSLHIHELKKILPYNWEIKLFPNKIVQLLEDDREILLQDGISKEDIKYSYKLLPKIDERCLWIDEFKLPNTIEHGDLFDENFLINNNQITITDWADAGVGHPFFSFGFFIERLIMQYNISRTCYLNLKKNYLHHWKSFLDIRQLNQLIISMNQLGKLKTIISYSRIAKITKNHDMDMYKGYLKKNFLDFIREFN